MIDIEVLSTAAGLQEFDAATVAAYCHTDEARVVLVLDEHGDLFAKRTARHQAQPTSPRYRVLHPDALARRISSFDPDPGFAPSALAGDTKPGTYAGSSSEMSREAGPGPFGASRPEAFGDSPGRFSGPEPDRFIDAGPARFNQAAHDQAAHDQAAPHQFRGRRLNQVNGPGPNQVSNAGRDRFGNSGPEASRGAEPERFHPAGSEAPGDGEGERPALPRRQQPEPQDPIRSRPRPPRSAPRPRRPERGDQSRQNQPRFTQRSFTSGGYTSSGTPAPRTPTPGASGPRPVTQAPLAAGTPGSRTSTPGAPGSRTSTPNAPGPSTPRARNSAPGIQGPGASGPGPSGPEASATLASAPPIAPNPTPTPRSRSRSAAQGNPNPTDSRLPTRPRASSIKTGPRNPAPWNRATSPAAQRHSAPQQPARPRSAPARATFPQLGAPSVPNPGSSAYPHPTDLTHPSGSDAGPDRLEVIHNRAPEPDPRITHAENTLLACAREADPEARHALASAAMSALGECIPNLPRDGELHTAELPPRLRFALTLATLTLIESTGQPIARKLLISAYDDATALAQEFLPSRQADLISRFRALTSGRSADYPPA